MDRTDRELRSLAEKIVRLSNAALYDLHFSKLGHVGNMTLLVAGADGQDAWMVADTAISNQLLDTRARQFRIKIEPGQGLSLLGYADNADRGASTVRKAASLPPGRSVLDLLKEVHMTYRDVDFAYAFVEDGAAHLYKIADGSAQRVPQLYLGDASAFNAYQEIRHSSKTEHAPDAMHQFFSWVTSKSGRQKKPREEILRALGISVRAMQSLFVRNSDRGVGGVAIPFLLTNRGPELMNYVYAVTDPIARVLPPGSVVPHGSAAQGGFALSVSELAEQDGLFVYWLQRPGGTVFIRRGDVDDVHEFDGSPREFVGRVKHELGREISLFFGESLPAPPHSLRLMYSEDGVPCLAIASSDVDFTFSWIHMASDSFKTPSIELAVGVDAHQSCPPEGMQGVVEDDGMTLLLTAAGSSGRSAEVPLTALQVDQLIRHLAQLRATMTDKVCVEPEGGAYQLSLDPAWRTLSNVHPEFPGVCLSLRDGGLGWQMYWLPPHEASALGEYLVTHFKSA